ncbi:MAG: hypothetical protein JXR81_10515 [Candidatus Goldbacteria bacterium]|nr:hypothetical protein [Candidatus Goldiibacteriota bacterium]
MKKIIAISVLVLIIIGCNSQKSSNPAQTDDAADTTATMTETTIQTMTPTLTTCTYESVLGMPCDGPDSDQCQEGVWNCDGCSDMTGDNVEVCNGIDDDCSGIADDNLTAPGYVCGTVGVCAAGVPECMSAGGWTCNYPAAYQAVESTCDDGLDNDCDGFDDCSDSDCPCYGSE